MSHSAESFFVGIVVGLLSFLALLYLTGTTPVKVQRNIHQEAVNLGYGNWVVNTNSDGGSPRTTFQWITNNISSK